MGKVRGVIQEDQEMVEGRERAGQVVEEQEERKVEEKASADLAEEIAMDNACIIHIWH